MRVDDEALQAALEEIVHSTFELLSREPHKSAKEIETYLYGILDDEVSDDVEAELRGMLRGAGFFVPVGAYGLPEILAPLVRAKLTKSGDTRRRRASRGGATRI